VYRVTVIMNGAVKATMMNAKTKPDQTTQLNVDVKPIGKHRVWVPSNNTLGSHIGGHWVEVEDGAKPEPGLLNVNKANAEQFQRQSERIESASGR
jgi:hypothetical protein